MGNYDLEKSANASLYLKQKVRKYVEKNIDENTKNAYAYTLQNMDELKYFLTAYKIYRRKYILYTHLKSQFGQFDHTDLNKLIFKNGIFSYNFIKIMVYWLPCIIGILVALFAYFQLTGFTFGATIFADIVLVLAYICLGERVCNSYMRTYRLSKAYRNLPIPSEELS